jgi:dTDP-4-dehydrorhamnose reductase
MTPTAPRLAWVIGAHGLLGRALVSALEQQGFDVFATASEVDIRDPAALRMAVGRRHPAVIFNAAAYTAVDLAEREADTAFAINADGAGHVAVLARERGAELVHFSTDYVFSGQACEPLREDAPTGPLNVYGASKLAGEQRVLATAEVGRRVFVVRTSWLFGAGRPNFVTTMLGLMRTRTRLEVVADQIGRPTFAPDLAEAALCLCGPGPEGGIYHVANAGSTSWHGFAEAIRDRALAHGMRLQVNEIVAAKSSFLARPAVRPLWSVLATEKFERLAPLRPWSDRLESYIAMLAAEPAFNVPLPR